MEYTYESATFPQAIKRASITSHKILKMLSLEPSKADDLSVQLYL